MACIGICSFRTTLHIKVHLIYPYFNTWGRVTQPPAATVLMHCSAAIWAICHIIELSCRTLWDAYLFLWSFWVVSTLGFICLMHVLIDWAPSRSNKAFCNTYACLPGCSFLFSYCTTTSFHRHCSSRSPEAELSAISAGVRSVWVSGSYKKQQSTMTWSQIEWTHPHYWIKPQNLQHLLLLCFTDLAVLSEHVLLGRSWSNQPIYTSHQLCGNLNFFHHSASSVTAFQL